MEASHAASKQLKVLNPAQVPAPPGKSIAGKCSTGACLLLVGPSIPEFLLIPNSLSNIHFTLCRGQERVACDMALLRQGAEPLCGSRTAG